MFDLTLTFDNGPDPETTPFVLDVLARRSIRTTFSVVGSLLGLRVRCTRIARSLVQSRMMSRNFLRGVDQPQ